MTDWRDVAERQDVVPIWCQQHGCHARVEIWCPLCSKFLCLEHDPLVPVRRHDCLRGPADEDAA
jgi:hypothetical protein